MLVLVNFYYGFLVIQNVPFLPFLGAEFGMYFLIWSFNTGEKNVHPSSVAKMSRG
jgi:uncharacterized membrane protein YesL